MTEAITAEIIGSDRCQAEGHTVRAAAPVLEGADKSDTF
jgi:hypothetical protein